MVAAVGGAGTGTGVVVWNFSCAEEPGAVILNGLLLLGGSKPGGKTGGGIVGDAGEGVEEWEDILAGNITSGTHSLGFV